MVLELKGAKGVKMEIKYVNVNFKNGFADAVDFVEDLIIGLAGAWVLLIFLGAGVVVLVVVLKKEKAKRKIRQQELYEKYHAELNKNKDEQQ